VDGHVNAERSFNLSILLERVSAAMYRRVLAYSRSYTCIYIYIYIYIYICVCICTRECTSHPSQVGCRGMSSEEFSRAPLEAAVKPECAFATATDFFVRALRSTAAIPLAENTLSSDSLSRDCGCLDTSSLAACVRRETRFRGAGSRIMPRNAGLLYKA